jgi:hypothetical protein
MNILDAVDDERLFAGLLRGPSWTAWRAVLAALFALPMTAEQATIYRECTGRSEPPAAPFREAAFVVGRRGGKSRILALIAVYLAAFIDYAPYLAPGEVPVVAIIAADRKQARVLLRYVIGTLRAVPALAPMIEEALAESVRLKNGVTLEIHTCSIASPRGRSFIAVLADEIAFWRSDDSANPDAEVIAAVRPGLASIPHSLLLMASSPYARRGVLWNAFRQHFGRDGARVLVWRGATERMNPTLDPAVIAEAREADPAHAAAEYDAEFRTDVETYIGREVVDAAIVPGRYELPPQSGVSYVGFVDPSGGSVDSMTLAIAHRERDGITVLDALREVRPPFSPESVVNEFAALLKTYRISKVAGDRYAGEWPREQFRKHGIAYECAEKAKSDIYRDLLPMLNSRKVELPDVPRLSAQLCGLERRTARGGRDSIDHPPGGHDDIANAAAGALLRAGSKPGPMVITDELLTMVGGRTLVNDDLLTALSQPYEGPGRLQ